MSVLTIIKTPWPQPKAQQIEEENLEISGKTENPETPKFHLIFIIYHHLFSSQDNYQIDFDLVFPSISIIFDDRGTY